MIFYDFEVFQKDWLVVLYDDLSGTETRFHNDRDALAAYYEAHAQDVWCGYNSRSYDRFILAAVLKNIDVKSVSDAIISNVPGARKGLWLDGFASFDARTSGCFRCSLKQLEGFAGMDIHETTVPFEIERALMPEEVKETFEYCSYDVKMCLHVFKTISKPQFDAQMFFIEKYGLPLEDVSLTQAQLAAKLLKGNGTGKNYNDADRFSIVDSLRIEKYRSILNWRNSALGRDINAEINKLVAGILHNFSDGGTHGALENYKYRGMIIGLDVTAYYPSIMAVNGFGQRVIDDWNTFLEIHNANVEFKRKGDKTARHPYKIMDNAITGQFRQEQSLIYDPRANREICINGQLMLLDLIEQFETRTNGSVMLIQTNTDGIFLELRKPERIEEVRSVVRDWESRHGVFMDETLIDGVIVQKDVNNYLIADRDGRVIKAKGGDVRESEPSDYNFAVVRQAIREYFAKGTRPEVTINACNRLMDFQQIVQRTPKYEALKHGDTVYHLKTLRVFASTDEHAKGVYQQSLKTGIWEKVPRTPDRCFIDNGDIRGLSVPEALDKSFYIDFAYRQIYAWTGEILHDVEHAAPWEIQELRKKHASRKGIVYEEMPVSVAALLALDLPEDGTRPPTDEEIAAAVLRWLQDEGIDLNGFKWKSRKGRTWTALLRSDEDEQEEQRSLFLSIFLNEPVGARLYNSRYDSMMEWKLKPDTEDVLVFAKDDIQRVYDDAVPVPDALSTAGPGSVFALSYLDDNELLEYAMRNDSALRVSQDSSLLVPYVDNSGLICLQIIGPDASRFISVLPEPMGHAVHRIPGRSKERVVVCADVISGLRAHWQHGGKAPVYVCGSFKAMSMAAERLLVSPKVALSLAVRKGEGEYEARNIKKMDPGRINIEISCR